MQYNAWSVRKHLFRDCWLYSFFFLKGIYIYYWWLHSMSQNSSQAATAGSDVEDDASSIEEVRLGGICRYVCFWWDIMVIYLESTFGNGGSFVTTRRILTRMSPTGPEYWMKLVSTSTYWQGPVYTFNLISAQIARNRYDGSYGNIIPFSRLFYIDFI